MKAESLDIATVKVTPKLPTKVVATAKKKVTTPVKVVATGNTGTTAVVPNQDDYLAFVPETETNWLMITGTVLLVGGLCFGIGKYLYDKFKKSKISNGNG